MGVPVFGQPPGDTCGTVAPPRHHDRGAEFGDVEPGLNRQQGDIVDIVGLFGLTGQRLHPGKIARLIMCCRRGQQHTQFGHGTRRGVRLQRKRRGTPSGRLLVRVGKRAKCRDHIGVRQHLARDVAVQIQGNRHAPLKAELSPHHRQQIAFRVVDAHGARRPVQVEDDRVGRQCRFERAVHRVAKRAVAVGVEPPARSTGARRKDGDRGPVPFLKIGHAACQFTLAAQCPVTHFGHATRHTPF